MRLALINDHGGEEDTGCRYSLNNSDNFPLAVLYFPRIFLCTFAYDFHPGGAAHEKPFLICIKDIPCEEAVFGYQPA